MSKDDLDELKRKAQALGYELRPQRPQYRTTGFAVEVKLLDRFRKCATSRKVKMQDAINQAIEDWLTKHECNGNR
jgi:hypothetical protein